VVVIDFTKGTEKFSVYPIPEFYSTIIKNEQYSPSLLLPPLLLPPLPLSLSHSPRFSQGVDFMRMRESHANHRGPAFIAAIIQPLTIASYVIPLA
jgi:hypothetical protein